MRGVRATYPLDINELSLLGGPSWGHTLVTAFPSISGAESLQSIAVLLENVPDNMSRDLLLMLLEHVSGLDEGNYSLEIIWETNSAVVTFNSQSGMI